MTREFVPQAGTVEVNGLRLHYLDWGNTDAPSMLLLHGTSSHAHMWDHFATAFQNAFHVVALDQRGFGDSQWPPGQTISRGICRSTGSAILRGSSTNSDCLPWC